jgi:putative ABC transport system permease protein
MTALREGWFVARLNLASVRSRPMGTLVIVLGIAASVGVLTAALSMSAGLLRTMETTGRADRVVIESDKGLDQQGLAQIRATPGLARDARGSAIVSAETYGYANVTVSKNRQLRLTVHGISPDFVRLHPELRIVSGRMFRPGLHELIVGASLAARFTPLTLGDHVKIDSDDWLIVGRFVSEGNALQSQLLGDVDSLMSNSATPYYDDVLALLRSPSAFGTVKAALGTDAILGARVERESDYYRGRSSGYYALLRVIAFVIAGIMSTGAVLGAVTVFHSTISARAVEMGTLRAVGFSAGAIAMGVLIEAAVIGVIGAATGSAVACFLFNGDSALMLAGLNNTQVVYSLTVTAHLMLLSIVWGCITGMLGGLAPALQAARQPVAIALRET